jgi:tRNA (guanine37-N1)-methyltransferase
MRFDVISIFPDSVDAILGVGVLGQARDEGRLQVVCHDLRDYTDDPHRVVDDRPFGGGPGMVMKVEPFVRALEAIRMRGVASRAVLLSSQGRLFAQADAVRWSRERQLIVLCGRYQGVDERLLAFVDEDVSIGDYVLAGGEAAAAVIVEATARMLPGVVGQFQSVEGDSFYGERALGAPQYTRPREFRGLEVPEVLISGNHEQIARERERWAWEKTARNRPDLIGLRPDSDDG